MKKCMNRVIGVWHSKSLLTAFFFILMAATFGIRNVAAQDVLPVSADVTDETVTAKASAEAIGEIMDSGSRVNDLITAMSYAFSVQTGVALEDMSSGTTTLVAASQDDTASAVTNIGFDFWYDGVRYTQFSVNANGLARLGSTVIATTFNNTTSGLNTVTNAPKIAPYFEDLCTGTTGGVRSKVVGTAPNRKLVVEWFGMQVSRGAGCVAGPATGNFQMWLFESSGSTNPGVIQFVYGNGIVASQAVDEGASVGLQSGAATNFASVTVSDDTVSYATANNLNLPGIP